jgi:hypothetical protein
VKATLSALMAAFGIVGLFMTGTACRETAGPAADAGAAPEVTPVRDGGRDSNAEAPSDSGRDSSVECPPGTFIFGCTNVNVMCGPTRNPPACTGDDGGAIVDAGCTFPVAKNVSSVGCAPGCQLVIPAEELDEEGGCFRRVVLGCLPYDGPHGGAPEGRYCAKSLVDGRLVILIPYDFDRVIKEDGWVRCTTEEAQRLGLSTPCP